MRRKEKEEEEAEVLGASAALQMEGKELGPKAKQGVGSSQYRRGKRKRQSLATVGGGFIGDMQLSEASSESPEEESENEDDRRCKRGKATKAFETQTGNPESTVGPGPNPRKEAEHSSSSEEEAVPMVTARSVFESKKGKGRSFKKKKK